jgi:TP901 family phage tail tape measure protein
MPNQVQVTVSGKNESQRATTEATTGVGSIGKAAQQTNVQYGKLLDTIGRTDDVSRAAMDGAENALDRFDNQVQRSKRSLDGLGDGAQHTGGRLGTALSETAGDAASSLADKLGAAGSVLGKLGPVGIAVGAAIGLGLGAATLAVNKLKDAVESSIERAKAASRIGAQLGLDTPQQVAQLGRISGKVYADNFTDSLESAATAVRDVIRNRLLPEDATDSAITKLTEKLATVADLFEDDTSRVSATVSQLLRTGLAKSADEALDVLTRGLQEGADKSQDLLDTLNEYPTQFRKLGLSAADATGILIQGLRAGARDSDIVADALKEFSIRAVDGSKLTADSFKQLGLNGKQMAADIAAGGTRANKALDLTLDRLRAVKDPVQQAQIAVGLFGTQAEDLGAALFALDPSKAAQQIGKLEGAADRAAGAIGDNLGSRVETLQRKFEMWGADIGDKLVPVIDVIIDKLEQFAHWVGPILQDALQFLKDRIDENRDGLEKFGDFLKALEPILKVLVAGAIIEVAGAIGLMIEGLAAAGENWDRLKHFVLIATLFILDMLGKIVDGAHDAFGWIPGIGGQLDAAKERFHNFANSVREELEGIPDQQINVRINVTGGEAIGGIAGAVISQGLSARRHASGGPTGQGWSLMNEMGPEAVHLPTGSTVIPAGATAAMAPSGGGGWPEGLVPVSIATSSRLVSLLLDEIAAEVRKRGGKAAVIGITKPIPST